MNSKKGAKGEIMRKIIGVSLSFFLVFVFCSVSEAAGLKSDIIGKWVKDGTGDYYEFFKDGTILAAEGADVAGDNYEVLDKNRIKMDLGPLGRKEFEVFIDKEGGLNLKGPAGEVSRYLSEKEIEALIKKNFTFSDLTVLDKTTKLMWSRDANISANKMNLDDAFQFVKQLNEKKYAGYSDWRVPENVDFKTLVDFAWGKGFRERLNDFYHKRGFNNLQGDDYWSSSVYAEDPAFGWVVAMIRGSACEVKKSYNAHVWLVRSVK